MNTHDNIRYINYSLYSAGSLAHLSNCQLPNYRITTPKGDIWDGPTDEDIWREVSIYLNTDNIKQKDVEIVSKDFGVTFTIIKSDDRTPLFKLKRV